MQVGLWLLSCSMLPDYMKSVGQVRDINKAVSTANRTIKEACIPSAQTTESATTSSDSATRKLPESDHTYEWTSENA